MRIFHRRYWPFLAKHSKSCSHVFQAFASTSQNTLKLLSHFPHICINFPKHSKSSHIFHTFASTSPNTVNAALTFSTHLHQLPQTQKKLLSNFPGVCINFKARCIHNICCFSDIFAQKKYRIWFSDRRVYAASSVTVSNSEFCHCVHHEFCHHRRLRSLLLHYVHLCIFF